MLSPLFWVHLCASLILITDCAHPFLTPKLCGLGLLLGFLAWRRVNPRLRLGTLALLAWPIISGFWAVNRWDFLLGLSLPLLCFGTLVCCQLNEEDREQIAASLGWGGAATAAYLALQTAGLDPLSWEAGSIPGSFFGNPNFSADYMLLALCFGRFNPRWASAAKVLLVIGILLSSSRGVWLATLLWFAFCTPSMQVLWKWAISASIGVALLVGVFSYRHDIYQGAEYLTHLDSYVAAFHQQPQVIDDRDSWFRGKRASLLTRLVLWGNTAALIGEHPILGSGTGQFHVSYPRFANAAWPDPNLSNEYRAESPHNLVLELATWWGLPYTILLLSLGGIAWWRIADASYRIGVALQMMIALVSLNYLNPTLVMTLLLLRPLAVEAQGASRQNRNWPGIQRLLGALIALSCGLLAFLDLRAEQPQARWPDELLFCEQLAREAYRNENYRDAWYYQRLALDQDPYGPELRNNLGIIATVQYTMSGSEQWLAFAATAYRSSLIDFPYYRSAAEHLAELKERYGPLPSSPADFFAVLPEPEGLPLQRK